MQRIKRTCQNGVTESLFLSAWPSPGQNRTQICTYIRVSFFVLPKVAIYIVTCQINIILEKQWIKKYYKISYTLKTIKLVYFLHDHTSSCLLFTGSWIYSNKTNEQEHSLYSKAKYLHCYWKVLKRYLKAIGQNWDCVGWPT